MKGVDPGKKKTEPRGQLLQFTSLTDFVSVRNLFASQMPYPAGDNSWMLLPTHENPDWMEASMMGRMAGRGFSGRYDSYVRLSKQ